MSKKLSSLIIFLIALLIGIGANKNCYADEVASLSTAPEVPAALSRAGGANVTVELETVEKKGTLADGVEYTFWTFNGTVPGPFARVKEGDTVTFNLKNSKNSKNIHSIDIHAVNGPGGGAKASQTPPGGKTAFQFKALNPGIYIYHCASSHIPTHIANGMYGLLLVEPADGLPKVDKEYYVMQGDFYTKGKTGEKGLQAFDVDKARAEQPTYVKFNAMATPGNLKANVGEIVRLYVGNGGPNMTSAFHVIGEIFDTVYQLGAVGSETAKNVQTTVIPPGAAAIVEFKVDVPGAYILVDHAIFRAIDKGAVGILEVTGNENPAVFKPLKAGTADSGH
ncbi:MAG: nitrite reductase, copper-containing [Nitrospinae bacterium RIFCSPLOWO2_02_39_17]|nr:MAG: nitrite reductase, copper-containing [Nitrospinae bacterium RIFCSPHIGHO2_02_39_11]OGW00775.1 MAG: nitrite reductase, copper-containing [Nitrospinae bacterium RIFCSPHIGHO2_12_FULL_39_42]OGW01858.1 MAG: nitrite reductase, copper-containing [Nitrospinae bacterium RIFCSPHIGHO2_02_FULL_39_82]OGW03953.1 MAG: nitrite reductase, copper-containing [Nitrospinae bacterium RIFCSPLOWO2_02_39_17]OGW11443.1 MAG: nitrite reductase, copper-containing [Nitrospinae bacterium RIFCSPLOWO2_12_39_15]OGW11555